MIDRIIGLVGIALSILFAFMQNSLTILPKWVTNLGINIGIFIVGVSIGLFFSKKANCEKSAKQITELRLRMLGDLRVPEVIASNNIYRWYHLWVKRDFGNLSRVGSIVVIAFDKTCKCDAIQVRSPDTVLPEYEIMDYNYKFAIIIFHGFIPKGTLEICAINSKPVFS